MMSPTVLLRGIGAALAMLLVAILFALAGPSSARGPAVPFGGGGGQSWSTQ